MTSPGRLMPDSAAPSEGRIFGKYLVLDEIASGGMATVHLAHVEGQDDRFVAVKCMHAHYSRDPDFVSMFLDEAMLCTRIRHQNVVETIDVSQQGLELLLVLELVDGESLSRMVKSVSARNERLPPEIVSAVVRDMLQGLHAAHEATSENGEPLMIVHRDVSPHNVLVGTDGIARVLDFGVAKARGRVQQTQKGQLKGKLAYMSPEQARGRAVDRRSDVFSAGIVLWELLVGQRLFEGENEAALLIALLSDKPVVPSQRDASLARFDGVVMKALETDPDQRYPTALAMAGAIEAAIPPASRDEVAAWVKTEARASLARRQDLIRRATGRVAAFRGSSLGDAATPRGSSPELLPHDPKARRNEASASEESTRAIEIPVLEATAVNDNPFPQRTALGTPGPLRVPRVPSPQQGTAPHPSKTPIASAVPTGSPHHTLPMPPTAAAAAHSVIDRPPADSAKHTLPMTNALRAAMPGAMLAAGQVSPRAALASPQHTLPIPGAPPRHGPSPSPGAHDPEPKTLQATAPPRTSDRGGVHQVRVPSSADLLWESSTTDSDDDGKTLAIPAELNPIASRASAPDLGGSSQPRPPPMHPQAHEHQPKGLSVFTPPSFAVPDTGRPERISGEAIPSQVTSVTLTTTDLPPPLSKEHAQRLWRIATISGCVGSVVGALLIVLASGGDTPQGSKTPRAATTDEPRSPPATATSTVRDEIAPATPSADATTPVSSSSASSSGVVSSSAGIPMPSAAPKPSSTSSASWSTSSSQGPRPPSSSGFLNRPPSSAPKPGSKPSAARPPTSSRPRW